MCPDLVPDPLRSPTLSTRRWLRWWPSGRGAAPCTRTPPRRRARVTGPSRAQSLGTRDGQGILFVAHDGDVYPAGFLPVTLGNVRERSIVELYREDPLLRAIRATRFGGRCGVCDFAERCGGSGARAFATSGDPLGEDPACAYRRGAGGTSATA
jgi:radical SAM protein with 4Fe4S-binding SPASM domain